MQTPPENKMDAAPENKTASTVPAVNVVRCQCGELVEVKVTEPWHRCRHCFGKVFWPPLTTLKRGK